MNLPFPNQPSQYSAKSKTNEGRFRWRILPVSFFALLAVIALILTVFDLSVWGYALIRGAPEKWHTEYGYFFLRNGMLGLVQSLLLGLGSYYIWKLSYKNGISLLIAGTFVRVFAKWIFSW